MTEAKQAALAGTLVFLVLLGLMLLAAMALASPICPVLSEAHCYISHDLRVSLLIDGIHKTFLDLENLESGCLRGGAGNEARGAVSSLDLPWISEEHPEWRYAFSCIAASPKSPAGYDPVCPHRTGGLFPVLDSKEYGIP